MTATFVILAPILVIAALGLLVVRKAVHAALLLAIVMIGLAMLYATLDAPFLFAVQIVVYTGAILMLFLFVVMLVGVDRTESLRETIAGQKVLAGIFGVSLGAVLVICVMQLSLGTMAGLASANAAGNVQGLAALLFGKYVIAFEATAALLITAALGAMVLAHRERLEAKDSQADLARSRLKEYAAGTSRLGPLPPPGTFARHNANDTPALLPDGSTAPDSVPSLLGGGSTTHAEPGEANGVSTGSTDVVPTDAATTDDSEEGDER